MIYGCNIHRINAILLQCFNIILWINPWVSLGFMSFNYLFSISSLAFFKTFGLRMGKPAYLRDTKTRYFRQHHKIQFCHKFDLCPTHPPGEWALRWKGNTDMSNDQCLSSSYTPITLDTLLYYYSILLQFSRFPVFYNSWFLTKMVFLNFATPKAHFSAQFQLFSSKFLKNCSSLAPFAKKISSLHTHRNQNRVPQDTFMISG